MNTNGRHHPHEYELADYKDNSLNDVTTARIKEHLSICPACRATLDQFGEDPCPNIPSKIQWVHPPTLPRTIRDALREHRVAVPAPGQVWRLRGTQTASGEELLGLAVVLRADEELLVAPVTTDPREATDLWTLQTAIDGTSVSAWMALQCPMGYEVLDVLLGQVDHVPLLEVHRAFRRGERPPLQWSMGRHLDDELRLHRDRIRDSFIALSEIRVDGSTAAEVACTDSDVPSVSDQVSQAGWDVVSIAATLGISPGQARGVLTGVVTLTSEQARQLGVDPGSPAASSRPEPGWVRAVAGPELRPRYEHEAQRRHEDPWSFREECLHSLIAARGNRGDAAHWFSLAEQQLQRLEAENLSDT